jgi:hypothetical protein
MGGLLLFYPHYSKHRPFFSMATFNYAKGILIIYYYVSDGFDHCEVKSGLGVYRVAEKTRVGLQNEAFVGTPHPRTVGKTRSANGKRGVPVGTPRYVMCQVFFGGCIKISYASIIC